MSAVGFNCSCCAKKNKCNIRPKDNFKIMTREDGFCFVSQKSVLNLSTYTFGKRKRGRPRKSEQPVEVTENADI